MGRVVARSIFSFLLITTLSLAGSTAFAAGREERIVNNRPDRTWAQAVGGFFTSSKSVAVVIGISDYTGGYPKLAGTSGDADKMVRFLKNDAGFDIIYVLTEENATMSKVEHLMTDVIPNEVGQYDRFLFYWSGHGDQKITGSGNDARAFGFLPLFDSKFKIFSTMISMQDIARWDSYLQARQAIFVLDSCLSGLAGVQAKGIPELRLDQLSQTAHLLFTAGTDKENVIAGDRWAGSLFTDSFILGATGEATQAFGFVSSYSLVEYIGKRVLVEAQAVNWSSRLTPQLHELRASNGQFFFAIPKKDQNFSGRDEAGRAQTVESKGSQPLPQSKPPSLDDRQWIPTVRRDLPGPLAQPKNPMLYGTPLSGAATAK
jgi:Caspase domain